jgi:DNA-binding MarR family transcriptional regulator
MKLQLSLSNLITKAARVVVHQYQRELAHLGISPSQGGVVYVLSLIGDSTQVEIARRLFLEKTNVNAMVRKLEKAGHVSIAKDLDDTRKSRVGLTETGRALAAELTEIDRKVGADYLALAGSPEEAIIIRRFLETILFGSEA